MSKAKSVGDMVRELESIAEEIALNPERHFIREVFHRSQSGSNTTVLSGQEVERVVELHEQFVP